MYVHSLCHYEWFQYKTVCLVFSSEMMAACFYWKGHVWLMFIYIYIYIYIYDDDELIQIFKSTLGRFVLVFVLPNALDRFPHEGTLSRPLPYLLEDLPVWSLKPGVNCLRTQRRML